MVAFGNKTWRVSKGSTIGAIGDMIISLYFLFNDSNNVVNLASIVGNVNKNYHNIRIKCHMGLGKVGKGV